LGLAHKPACDLADNEQAHKEFIDGQVECTVTVMVKVDLVAIDREAPLIVEIPIEYVGRPKALILGAQLHVVRRSIEVLCRPADIPSKLVVNIADLDVNGVIHVSDMTLPPNVEAHSAGHYALITCVAGEVKAENQ